MSETSFSSFSRPQGDGDNQRNQSLTRRWLLALALSLGMHLVFWGIRLAIPVAEVPRTDPSQTMMVSLTPAPTKSNTSESKSNGAPEQTPPEPVKAKPPSQPKAKTRPVTPKPVPRTIEEPTYPQATDTRPLEPPKESGASAPAPAPASGKSQSSAPSSESSPGHFEGPKLNADYLHNPRPDYPVQAKRMGWEGRVVLRVEVLANGSAGVVSIAKTSGHDLLDEAALEAVRRWKFVPAKRDGIAVNSSVNVPINFNLKNE